MKRLISCAISLIVLAAIGGDDSESVPFTPPAPNGQQVGRFQLFEGVVSYDLATETTERVVFRIDTATGRVWRYDKINVAVNVPEHPELKSTTAEGWQITSEDFFASRRDAMSFGRRWGKSKSNEPAK